jgi:chorismate mutase/prephenate dehydratase
MSEIEKQRGIISACDREIARLLHRRAEAARQIGRHKEAAGEPFYDASRQKQVLDLAVRGAGEGAFPIEGLRAVFAEIMSACLNLERPTRVGYLGPKGTFSHMAARAEFGTAPDYRELPSIEEIFRAVERGWVDYGVVPVENSVGGAIYATLDMFLDTTAMICSEILVRVAHHLIAKPGVEKGAIKRVYSHPQGFAQCRLWLKQNMPSARLVEAESTAQGALKALEDAEGAAIGSELAAQLYEMNILEPSVEDSATNRTRFFVLGKHPGKPAAKSRTSILFSLPDRPGALHHTLEMFSDAGLNLTKIESRPSRKKAWDYVFFVEMNGHVHDPMVGAALGRLERECAYFKLLGSYAIGE